MGWVKSKILPIISITGCIIRVIFYENICVNQRPLMIERFAIKILI